MKFNILLIDDNDVDNYISKYALEAADVANEIIAVSSGVDALAHLKEIDQAGKKFPDLIFLDINMPRMNGFEFLDEFRSFSEARDKKCCVAMLTSSNSPDDRARAMKSPFVKCFFNKPLGNDVLREIENCVKD